MRRATLLACAFVLTAIAVPSSFGQASAAQSSNDSQARPPASMPPMAADANPAFEVATIKPGNPNTQSKGLGLLGRNFSVQNYTLSDLIAFAYGVHLKQIVDGPDWLGKDHFDIAAVPDAKGRPSVDQFRVMAQKLMTDRFKLRFHHEKRELTIYALVVGKNGPKLTKNESDSPGSGDSGIRLGNLSTRLTDQGMTFAGRDATMTELALSLQRVVTDRPVVDQTGLTDRFDFQFTFTPDDSQFGGIRSGVSEAAKAAPSLFTAIQEIGLKLDAVKAPVDVIVIDSVEKPTPN